MIPVNGIHCTSIVKMVGVSTILRKIIHLLCLAITYITGLCNFIIYQLLFNSLILLHAERCLQAVCCNEMVGISIVLRPYIHCVH